MLIPATVRPDTETVVLNDIARFVQSQNWQKLILVHDSNTRTFKTASFDSNGVEVSLKINATILDTNWNILKNSHLRVIVLLVDYTKASDIICRYWKSEPVQFTRYIWLSVVKDAAEELKNLRQLCPEQYTTKSRRIIFFQTENIVVSQKVSQVFDHVIASDLTLTSDVTLQLEAAYSYDATTILLNCLRAVGATTPGSGSDVVNQLAEAVRSRRWLGVTGNINFDETGHRHVTSQLYSYTNEGGRQAKLISLGIGDRIANMKGEMERDTIDSRTELEGIPLSLFIIMCSLAGLGIVYAIAIMIFNIVKRGHRIIKMTSPNINVVIMLGCCGIYAAMVMLGLDTTRISRNIMETLIQAAIYVIVIGFSVIYGLISAKSWRVFMIFKNLTTNGKMTRDEHLLLGLFVMILLDFVVLIPWHLVDPIKCSRKAISEVFESENVTDVTTEVDICYSEYQSAWVAVIYAYKALILGMGFIFSWQTRHVTLPALRDTRMVYVTICLVVVMSLVALPVLVVRSTGVIIRYAVGALILWLTATFTITLLFLNKVFLYRKEAKRVSQGESFRFQFTESMKRTQEAIRKLAGCLCCGVVGEDKYAQEMLLTEIECLKRTIKDKDLTIRELNDRLYVGAQKFHEYLKSPRRQQIVEKRQTTDVNTTHRDYRHGNPEAGMKHVMYVDDDRTNGHLDITSDGLSATKKADLSDGRIALSRRQNQQQNYQYASLNRISDAAGTADVNHHMAERRFNVNDASTVPFHRGTNSYDIRDVPVYTIEVHRSSQERTAPSLYAVTPDKTRTSGSYHQECHHPKSSPNFDSAIDSNSPSSTSSESFHNTKLPGPECEHPVNASVMDPITEKHTRSYDVRIGCIDLEAIESEVANSQQNWMDGCFDTKYKYRGVNSGKFINRQERSMQPINSDHLTAPHHSRVIFDDCSMVL